MPTSESVLNMRTNILLTIILAVFFVLPSMALTRFPKGTCKLEGLLIKDTKAPDWYFIVNPSTEAETRFKLKTFSPAKGINENGQYIEAVIEIPTSTFSTYGEAEFKNISKQLNPYEPVKLYNTKKDAAKACR